ncbi:hypothetical protein KIL84_008402 [Mauremys mutica]|uniref:Uncharacterized protein n=1 Tax=Mauremys mutica TaxID=74926 RepID=A0A9D4AYT0_9SAUR|nr:hypothetical protein KIL84_008402 [Mauremys mutica]
MDFKFLVSIVVWHDILFQGNVGCKAIQTQSMDNVTATTLMRSCLDLVVASRDNGFEDAKELVENVGIEPVFKETHIHQKQRQFGCEVRDEVMGSSEEKFKREVFCSLIDIARVSIKKRESACCVDFIKYSWILQDEKEQYKCRVILLPRHEQHSRDISAGHQTPEFLQQVPTPRHASVSDLIHGNC